MAKWQGNCFVSSRSGVRSPLPALSFFSNVFNTQNQKKVDCRDRGSNTGPLDLQSNALPTELSQHSYMQQRQSACHKKLSVGYVCGKKTLRHRRDSNSRGQSPLAFKTNSLTTRTRCRFLPDTTDKNRLHPAGFEPARTNVHWGLNPTP
jgi:hypothetical protein